MGLGARIRSRRCYCRRRAGASKLAMECVWPVEQSKYYNGHRRIGCISER